MERDLFDHLAVFAGGLTLEAAEAVGAAVATPSVTVLDLLTSLVAKSLAVKEEAGGDARYRLLETLRAYGRERLQEHGAAHGALRRHATYYATLAGAAATQPAGSDQAAWPARLAREHDNLRTALGWLHRVGEVEPLQRLATALRPFWEIRGYFSEGRGWLELALAADQDGPANLRAEALNAVGLLVYRQGDYANARAAFQESLAIRRERGDTAQAAFALNNLGLIAYGQGDYEAARTAFEESLAGHRAAGNTGQVAWALNNLGAVAFAQGDYTAAQRWQEESLALRRELGDTRGIAFALNNLADVARAQGDRATARVRWEESLARFRELATNGGSA